MSARSGTGRLSSDWCVRRAPRRTNRAQSAPTFCSFALTFWFAICICRTQSLRPSFVMEASAENDLAADDSAALSVEDIFGGGARRVRGPGVANEMGWFVRCQWIGRCSMWL